jgi:hypothetical protein
MNDTGNPPEDPKTDVDAEVSAATRFHNDRYWRNEQRNEVEENVAL